MSRQSRRALEEALGQEVRGWQTDQDLFDEAVATLAGLNRTDARCLDIVARDGPLTAGELARAVHLTTGAVTAILDRLEAAGYVRRGRDTVDRRRVLVEATPKVEKEMAAAFGPFLAEAERDLRSFSDADLGVIVDFLRRSRALLVRHTERLHEMLDAGDRGENRG